MVYATRSKGPAEELDIDAIEPLLRQATATKKKRPARKKALGSINSRNPPISNKHKHHQYLKGGEDHHVVEQDGDYHDHNWYPGLEANGAQKIQANANGNQTESNRSESNRHHRTLVRKLPTDLPATETRRQYISKKLSRVGMRSSLSVARGSPAGGGTREGLHIRFNLPEDEALMVMDDPCSGSDSIEAPLKPHSNELSNSQIFTSRAERAKAYFSSFFQRREAEQAKTSFQDADSDMNIQAGTESYSAPMGLFGAVAVRGDDHLATTAHCHEGDSATTTTTATTQSSDSNKNNFSHDILDTHLLTQKSQVDRQIAQNAIVSLDHDVVLLQRHLHEKEEALQSAEERASGYQHVVLRAETLRQEVHDLEAAIRNLRAELEAKEQILKESQEKNAEDHMQSQMQLIQLEQEISKLNSDLVDKEQVQQEMEAVQKHLDETNSQQTTLIVQIHELGAALKGREAELDDAQTTIRYLEEINHTFEADSLKVKSDLILLNASMTERGQELEGCKRRTEALQRTQEKVQFLEQQLQTMHDQLASSEADLKDLEKTNKILTCDSARAEELTEEVRVLHAHIKDSEWNLDNAMESLKDLAASKVRADSLEDEIKSLRAQAKVQEKHLRYLERALNEHEKCALEKRRVGDLEKELKDLRDQVDVQEMHLSYLENALQAHENCASEVQRTDNLLDELKGLLDVTEIQEKHLTYLEDALQSHGNCAFEAQKLRESIGELKAQLDGKEAELGHAKMLQRDREGDIKTLKSEIQAILDEVQTKDRVAQQLKEKSDDDLFRVSSTASILRTEVESLREQLKEKSSALMKAEKDTEELGGEKAINIQLQAEVKRLENMIADKDQHSVFLNMVVESMRERVQNAERLDNQVESLQKEKVYAEVVANQSAKDLAAVSTTASTLIVEVESLREQLFEKENELLYASKLAQDLELKSDQIKKLLLKIASLEESSEDNLVSSQQAEKNSKALEAEIRAMETRLSSLQGQFERKEADLQTALNKANQEHQAAAKRLEESQSKMSDLTTQLKETEKASMSEIKSKEGWIHDLLQNLEKWEYHEEGWVNKTSGLTSEIIRRTDALRHKEKCVRDLRHKANDQNFEISRLNEAVNTARTELRDGRKKQIRELQEELEKWESHEEGWIIRTSALTSEIIRGTEVIHQKEKLIHDLRKKAMDQNLEVGRLNEAVDIARTELRENRKRKAIGLEEQVNERTLQLQNDKSILKRSVSELEDHIVHLQKKIRLDHDQMISELELGEKVRELTYWKQTSIEQIKEWEDERDQQAALLSQYEYQIQSLESKVGEANDSRTQAIKDVEESAAKIVELEKELVKLKRILANYDADNTELVERVHSLRDQIEVLEEQRVDLQRQACAKDVAFAELEDQLREDVSNSRGGLTEARHELVIKNKEIDILNSRISEYSRPNKNSLFALENTITKLRNTLASQVYKYKVLDKKHKEALAEQVSKNMQLDQPERGQARVYNEDTEDQQGLLRKDYHLEEKLKEALQRTNDLQIEVHNITRTYHLTLTQLKNAQEQMSKMVPIEKVSHASCAARVHVGKKGMTRLSDRIAELKDTIDRMTKDQSLRESEWVHAEEGYKDRVQLMAKSQDVLESQLQDAFKARERERTEREQDRRRAESERQALEDTIQSLMRN